MSSGYFLVAALALVTVIYAALRERGDTVGWWLGLAHGGVALAAIVGVMHARDTGFAVFTGVLAVYAGAMCAAEAIHMIRRPGCQL